MPKNWGTTGYAVNTAHVKHDMTTWKQFWDLSMTDYSGRTIVHDYQLTTIGNALKYFGYSFNSVDPNLKGWYPVNRERVYQRLP